MAFSMGCFACCVPCDPCEATCDEEPAEPFAVVYQVEDDRANLTWTGDAMGPIDGPWSGFESGSVFTQTITTTGVALPGSRFPCYFRLKLWRNVGGGEGSNALDHAYTIVSCTEGKLDLGIVQLNAGESAVFTSDTSLSFNNPTYIIETGSGGIYFDDQAADRHAFPPALSQIAGIALCAGTSVSVQSTIVWSNDLIQHNLYGQFQECFDEPPPGGGEECFIDCDGTPTTNPSTVYMTISNFDAGVAVDQGGNPVNYDGTYALDFVPFIGPWECGPYTGGIPIADNVANLVPPLGLAGGTYLSRFFAYIAFFTANRLSPQLQTIVASISVPPDGFDGMICGGDSMTGSATAAWMAWTGSAWEYAGSCSFDYEFSL